MKRTLEHCGLITRMGDKDYPPNQHGGRCDGYAVSETNDEPCYICKRCKLNTFMKSTTNVVTTQEAQEKSCRDCTMMMTARED